MADILDNLNPQQREAVSTTEGPVLILAGAGSGKTTVLTKRIAWILENDLAKRSQILAVTFTNKAAREMSERIERICGKGYMANVGTFHSVCARWLRREASRSDKNEKILNFSGQFSIYDQDSQIVLMRKILKNMDLKNDDGNNERSLARTYLSRISKYKNARTIPQDYGDAEPEERELAPIYEAYNKELLENDSLDFDDLLLYMVKLLEEDEEIREKYRQRINYIMVDEFQDVNSLQYHLLRLLLNENNNFCAVGDDDQSIYRFRGADVSIILRFEREFPQAKIVKLEQNYRSTQQILDVANAVVSHNPDRTDKHLWSEKINGLKPCLYIADEGRGEAQFVINTCKALRRRGYHYSDFAILYRTNAQSRVFEEALLREEGIGYEIVGGKRFYDRKEIRDILAYLYLCGNGSDSVALGRVISITPGIGDKTFDKIVSFSARNGEPILHVLASADRAGVSKAMSKKCAELYQWLRSLHNKAIDPNCSLEKLVLGILDSNGYMKLLSESKDEDDLNRLENIKELLNVLHEFDVRYTNNYSPEKDLPLREFLAEVSLLSDQDTMDDEIEKKDRLVMMTIHTSKGLEFPIVFLVGLEDDLLPHSRSFIDGDKGIEEERRLCYVGLTRAKKMLYISASMSRGMFNYAKDCQLSRFLYEMPMEFVGAQAEGIRAKKALRVLQEGKDFHAADKELLKKHEQEVHRKFESVSLNIEKRRELADKYPQGSLVRLADGRMARTIIVFRGKIWVRTEGDSLAFPVKLNDVELIERAT